MLSHIDVQAEVAESYPGTVATMFQSLAGTDDCNKTFDVTVEKILKYAKSKKGERYGLYFETGQGSEFTNGAANGVDMMVLESRKYGFSRAVGAELAKVQPRGAWLHVNDVAGFIGPEVFKSREQLVRCCLEDIVMGKLHGLTIGLDVCSTLHMAVSLEDLDWCQDQIMPANPVYLIALPTKNDPMLGYLTTSFQDHVRLREKFGFKVNDAMWDVLQADRDRRRDNKYTEHYGDPLWVYYQYRLAKGDTRPKDAVYAEGRRKMRRSKGEASISRPVTASRSGTSTRSSRPRSTSSTTTPRSPSGPSSRPSSSPPSPMSCRSAPCPRTATTTSPIRAPARH